MSPSSPFLYRPLFPPILPFLPPSYADAADAAKGTWRNFFEHPTTMQFDHHGFATTTYLATALLFEPTQRIAVRAAVHSLAVRATAAVFSMANVQAVLGKSTLLYLMPVPLAATHQVRSVALLSAVFYVFLSLRRPGAGV
ncbi:hypothetical protein EDB83DRAFT_2677824 [Lactarius deliciosus]|nr:hypothetical protein EDB83DRAFT_2677824 [Lactarius deliciosus]